MKITTVTVSYQRIFNLGNFESLRLECTLEASLEDGDQSQIIDGDTTVNEITNELFAEAKAVVKAQAMPVIRKRDEDLQAIKQSVPGGLE
jgi:outer membrane protein OmpA-like peptidoglycan-associated protein